MGFYIRIARYHHGSWVSCLEREDGRSIVVAPAGLTRTRSSRRVDRRTCCGRNSASFALELSNRFTRNRKTASTRDVPGTRRVSSWKRKPRQGDSGSKRLKYRNSTNSGLSIALYAVFIDRTRKLTCIPQDTKEELSVEAVQDCAISRHNAFTVNTLLLFLAYRVVICCLYVILH